MVSAKVKEKRKSERFKSPLHISYKLGSNKDFSEAVLCTDISGGGLGIKVADKIHKGNLVDIQISKGDSDDMINARGRVVWIKQLKDGKHNLGIEFTKLEDDYKFIEFMCAEVLSVPKNKRKKR